MSAATTARRSSGAERRALGYAILARCFAYPTESGLAELRELARHAVPAFRDTPLGGVCERIASLSLEGWRREHTELFTLTFNPDCPNFESAYLARDPTEQSEQLARVAGFYQAWNVTGCGTGYRPDEIGTELEFMSLMAAKEAYGTGSPLEGIARRGQQLFFQEHLGRWGLAFARAVSRLAAPGSFHALVAAALQAWLAEEQTALGVELRDVALAPSRFWDAERQEPQSSALVDVESIREWRR